MTPRIPVVINGMDELVLDCGELFANLSDINDITTAEIQLTQQSRLKLKEVDETIPFPMPLTRGGVDITLDLEEASFTINCLAFNEYVRSLYFKDNGFFHLFMAHPQENSPVKYFNMVLAATMSGKDDPLLFKLQEVRVAPLKTLVFKDRDELSIPVKFISEDYNFSIRYPEK